jgi:hypothetical protein
MEKCTSLVGGMDCTLSQAKWPNRPVLCSGGALRRHMVLVTLQCAERSKGRAGFFPVTVNYTAKAYAGGRIRLVFSSVRHVLRMPKR